MDDFTDVFWSLPLQSHDSMQSHLFDMFLVSSDCHIAPLFVLTSRSFGRCHWRIQHWVLSKVS